MSLNSAQELEHISFRIRLPPGPFSNFLSFLLVEDASTTSSEVIGFVASRLFSHPAFKGAVASPLIFRFLSVASNSINLNLSPAILQIIVQIQVRPHIFEPLIFVAYIATQKFCLYRNFLEFTFMLVQTHFCQYRSSLSFTWICIPVAKWPSPSKPPLYRGYNAV